MYLWWPSIPEVWATVLFPHVYDYGVKYHAYQQNDVEVHYLQAGVHGVVGPLTIFASFKEAPRNLLYIGTVKKHHSPTFFIGAIRGRGVGDLLSPPMMKEVQMAKARGEEEQDPTNPSHR